PSARVSPERLIRLMVGRDIDNLYPKPAVEIGEVLLRAEGISRRGKVVDIIDWTGAVRTGGIGGGAALGGGGRHPLPPGLLRRRPAECRACSAAGARDSYLLAPAGDRRGTRLPDRGSPRRGTRVRAPDRSEHHPGECSVSFRHHRPARGAEDRAVLAGRA